MRLAAFFAFSAILGAISLGASALAAAANLPDGRVWEKVSPAEKGNNDSERPSFLPQAGLAGVDESGIAYFSLNAFPGVENGGLVVGSIGRRSSTGWSTEFPTPPDINTDGAQTGAPLAFSADLNQVLVGSKLDLTGQSPAQVNLFIRTSSPLSFRRITPPYPLEEGVENPLVERPEWDSKSNVGVAPDFSRIYVQSGKRLTQDSVPLDGEQHTNLYEWDGVNFRNIGVAAGANAPVAGGVDISHPVLRPVSADGSQVVYSAEPATGGPHQVFVSRGNSVVEASAPAPGVVDPAGPQEAKFVGASADGASVFFASAAKLTANTETNGGTSINLYRYDVASGGLTDLTVFPEGPQLASLDALHVVVSPDGSSAYFAARAELAEGATLGAENLFRWNADAGIEFIATIPPGEGFVGFEVEPGAVTDNDGSVLAFTSAGGLTTSAPVGVLELYRFEAGQGLACISCQAGSTAPVAQLKRPSPVGGAEGHLISPDGSRIYFSSAAPLVAGDVNENFDAYEWEGGEAHLLSGGTDDSASFVIDSSPSGKDAFFVTRERLVVSDQDNNTDIYDAREGGGIAEPPPPGPPCEAESCRPPLTAAPASPNAASRNFNGAGNPKAKKKHQKKRHHKKHGKKKHHKKHGKAGHKHHRDGRLAGKRG
jgi:hypothetical protein